MKPMFRSTIALVIALGVVVLCSATFVERTTLAAAVRRSTVSEAP